MKFIKGGIYQSKYTNEDCVIIIEEERGIIYLYTVSFETNEPISNEKVCEKVEKELKYTKKKLSRGLLNNLHFFIEGYLEKVNNEILNELRKKVRKNN